MNKAILISIKPEWVEKILNGEKTIEIRKSMPKCDLPTDVYIYCSKGKDLLRQVSCYYPKENKRTFNYKIINADYVTNKIVNGKVVAKFTLNKVEELACEDLGYRKIFYTEEYDDLVCATQLSDTEMEIYFCDKELKKGNVVGYAWHIENLEIFDTPMELSEFYRNNWLYIFEATSCDKYDCEFKVDNSILGDDGFCIKSQCPKLRVKKAPQSWQYVNVVE